MPRARREVPWLETRDNGVYYAHWYDAERKQTCGESLKTRDPAEAAKRFGKFLIEGPRTSRSGSDAGLTVRQALDDYWREHVTAVDDRGRPHVVDTVRQENAMRHLKEYFGDVECSTIGPLESRAYVAARRAGVVGGGERRKDKRGSDSTIRRELVVLGAAVRHAAKWQRLPAGTVPRIELPNEERHADVAWLTKAQLNDALALAISDPPLRDFILLAYYTAARKRSVQELTKFQVDLANGRINLMAPDAKATKKRKPVVPIYDEIRPTIERLMQTNGEYLFGTVQHRPPSKRAQDRWDARNRYRVSIGKPPLERTQIVSVKGEPRDFYRPFVALMAEIGVVAHPHMLRHSRATHMLMDGEDLYKVSRLLGDTVATVDRVYAHVIPEYLKTTSGLKEVK